MKKMNTRKTALIFIIAAGLGSMTVGYQNFTINTTKLSETTKKESNLSDALTAAMATAEKDHVAKQMALNVEPGQVESSLKGRGVATVEVNAAGGFADTNETAKPALDAPDAENPLVPDDVPQD